MLLIGVLPCRFFYLVLILAHLYFEEKLPVTLSYAQASVLLCIGLQGHSFSYLEVLFLNLDDVVIH